MFHNNIHLKWYLNMIWKVYFKIFLDYAKISNSFLGMHKKTSNFLGYPFRSDNFCGAELNLEPSICV